MLSLVSITTPNLEITDGMFSVLFQSVVGGFEISSASAVALNGGREVARIGGLVSGQGVPIPATAALLGLGILGLGSSQRKMNSIKRANKHGCLRYSAAREGIGNAVKYESSLPVAKQKCHGKICVLRRPLESATQSGRSRIHRLGFN